MHRVCVRTLSFCGSRFVLLSCLVLGFAFLAFGQTGTMVGTVTDPSGAMVPNATIAVTNTGTNQTSKFTTNAEGQFIAPELQIGRYDLRAEAAGFKTFEQKDIALNVGDRRPLEIKLEVGRAQESVTVEANAAAVQTEAG